MQQPRHEVFAAIEGERAYQDGLGIDRTFSEGRHEVAGHLVMMDTYLKKAVWAWTSNPGNHQALHEIRKIAAIAVRCMEQHGAPQR